MLLKLYWLRLCYTYTESCRYLRWCRLGPKGFVFGVWFASVLGVWRLCWYTGILLGLCLGYLTSWNREV